MSLLHDILLEVARVQRGLGLTVDSRELGVVLRKLPKREEEVDLAYQTTVSGAEQVDECKRIAFGGKWKVVYSVDVTLITPNDRDQSGGLKDHTDWREATRRAFEKLNVPGVKGVEVVRSPMLQRSKLAQGYDYNQVSLLITTYETRL